MRISRLPFLGVVMSGMLLLGACNLVNKPAGPDDKAITSDIQSRLFQDQVLKTRDIRVDSQKGVVTLTGTVNSDIEKLAVERLANEATGVKQIVDQLTVSAATAAAAPPVQAEAKPAEKPKAARSEKRARKAANPSSEAEQASQSQPAPAPAAAKPAEVVSAPAPQPPPPPPPPVQVTVPAGTTISVRMIDGIDSARNQPGQEFAASLSSPVAAGDRVVFPVGSDARVRLVQAKDSGHFKGSAELQVELISISANGNTYNVESSYYQAQGASRGKRTAEAVGGGAALGAIIGAIAGGRKGAAIGAGAGAGTGAGVEAVTKGSQVKIPSETKIDFTLKSPVTVTMKP